MRANDLIIGSIYTIPGKRPGYALVLDTSTTYRAPHKKHTPGFVPTHTMKAHANGQGILVVLSKDKNIIDRCARDLDPEYVTQVAQRWPGSMEQLLSLLARDAVTGRKPLRVTLSVVSQIKLHPLSETMSETMSETREN